MSDITKTQLVVYGFSAGFCIVYTLMIASTYSRYLDLLCKVFAQ